MNLHGTTADELVRRLREDGFFILRSAFGRARVSELRPRLAAMLDEDMARIRAPEGASLPARYESWHSEHQHAILFPCVHSAGLAELFDEILSDPVFTAMTDRVLGREYRLRADDVRRLSGVNDWVDDFQLPHEWHRDSPGEFTFGVFFDDVTPRASGATTVIRGSHWQPYDPMWDVMFSAPSPISRELYLRSGPRIGAGLARLAVCNRLLKRRLRKRVVELSGAPGDVYFFLNDLWHGRAPNVHGSRNIIARVGGFPTDFPFKDDIPLPAYGMDDLPPERRRRYRRTQPRNEDPSTLLREIASTRKRSFDLYGLAAAEKRLLGRIALRQAQRRA